MASTALRSARSCSLAASPWPTRASTRWTGSTPTPCSATRSSRRQAAALLDEAGWRPGEGGLRRNAAGEPLRLELMTTAGNRTRELIQQVAQSQWRQLGIETVIRNEPARVFFGETTTKRRFTGLALFAWISSPENVPRTTLHSQEIPSEANGWSGQNFTGYRNPRMDALLDEIEVELDRDKRRAAVGRAAAALRRRAAGPAAVLPGRRAYLAEMADGGGADRAHGADHALGGALAGGRGLAWCVPLAPLPSARCAAGAAARRR